jgi:large subunit ribosomal protein LP0
MEPGKTSFFQALGVPTKIARGTIEITTDLKLVESGLKVGPSEATLLNMLNISPFTYGMGISQVYDQGNAFPPSVLDIGEDQLLAAFSSAITTIACISLAINFPTLASITHSLVNSYKNILAVAIETEYSWPEIEELKDRIANPDAYASAAPTAAAPTSGGDTKADEKADEKSDEESDEDGGFGGLLYVTLFPPKERPLTMLPLAIKCGSMFPVLGWHPCGIRLRLALQSVDSIPRTHRSFTGQLRSSGLAACNVLGL